MRKLFITSLFLLLGVFTFSQTAEEIFNESGEDFDIDDIFDTGEDAETPLVTETNDNTITINNYSIPLTFSGNLSAELGVGYINDREAESRKTGYIDLKNRLYLTSFPTKDLGVRAIFLIAFPSYSFAVEEVYFDYILNDMLYITAGKKSTTWGYVRLFTTDLKDSRNDKNGFGFDTNILSDSGSGTSVLLRFPFWTGTISAICLYRGKNTEPKMSDMDFAGSIEMTMYNTVVNVFGRKYPGEDSELKPINNGLLGGIELKRTILGFDIYGQGIAKFKDNQKVKELVKDSKLDRSTFGDIVYTLGLYRWWDDFDPNIGFNFEFQEEFIPDSKTHIRRIGFDGGVKRLGPRKNIKIGTEWMHSISDKTGYVKPGIIISGLFHHANWNNGVKFDYKDGSLKKITFGSYIEINLNY